MSPSIEALPREHREHCDLVLAQETTTAQEPLERLVAAEELVLRSASVAG